MQFNADLIDDVARRRVVLFLGSGVSASAEMRTHRKMKQWESFLKDAAGKLTNGIGKDTAIRLIEEKNYLMSCEIIRRNLENEDWISLLKEEFGQMAEQPSSLHKAIVRLDQRLILTTNFDKLYEDAWAKLNEKSTHYPTVIPKLDSHIFKIFRDNQNYIIKLHGSIDDPDSIIFTKSDYNKTAFGHWVYGDLLRVLLLTHTFIFIGFSMADPAVTFTIEMYAQRFPDARPHYIFATEPVPQELKVVSRDLRRLYIIEYKPNDDHHALPEHLAALADAADNRRREIYTQLRL